jgi:Xaa-Pro aminopeptidase
MESASPVSANLTMLRLQRCGIRNSYGMQATGISHAELSDRRAGLLDHAGTSVVLFDQAYIQYYTGFNFLSNERPVVVVVGDELTAFVPGFEVARTEAEGHFDRVEQYAEYPGEEHPMTALARIVSGPLAADQDGYPGILGYEGPALSEVTGASVATVAPFIEGQMRRKSPAEVELIRQSCRWCEHAHRLLQQYSVAGATEAEASLRAGMEATLAMLEALGPDYAGQLGSQDGATAGYRGQIGRRSAWAHAVAHNIRFEPGDMLVSETAAPVWGYNAELERGMVVGEPTDEQRRLFGHVVAAQEVAVRALRPGVTCADVDRAVLDYFDAEGIRDLWSQHTGHGIGLRNHEAPFLDVGDHTPVEPGMVFTIEPGVYKEGLGGFRHSDTVVVTENGIEILTAYPRDLKSLTIR